MQVQPGSRKWKSGRNPEGSRLSTCHLCLWRPLPGAYVHLRPCRAGILYPRGRTLSARTSWAEGKRTSGSRRARRVAPASRSTTKALKSYTARLRGAAWFWMLANRLWRTRNLLWKAASLHSCQRSTSSGTALNLQQARHQRQLVE